MVLISGVETLLAVAAEMVSSFLLSEDHDLKYLGLKSLNRIVISEPKHALEHQDSVCPLLATLSFSFSAKHVKNVHHPILDQGQTFRVRHVL